MQFLRNLRVAIQYQYIAVLYRLCPEKRRFDSRKGTFSSPHTPVKLQYRTEQVLYRTVRYRTAPVLYRIVLLHTCDLRHKKTITFLLRPNFCRI
jgi:hypothetical protein